MACVTSANYAVLVNGSPTSFFRARRGLRQGCPLSPSLFLLVIECLSRLLHSAKLEGSIFGISVTSTIALTHLFFVDDIILFGRCSLVEWQQLSGIFSLFCSASGMFINLQKSIFIINKADPIVLSSILDLFPVEVQEIDSGLIYLGYRLKPNCYRILDWHWLLSKVERKLMVWSNKLLSMAGRLVLINSVLNGLPVYWFSLAQLPISILNSLRKIIMQFLWNGLSDKFSYHLTSWEIICKPKFKGGWGIKHLLWFNVSLSLKTGWRALTGQGLWHRIIISKYLKGSSLVDWLRDKTYKKGGGSFHWRNFCKHLHWITNGLMWWIGDGRLAVMGLDPVAPHLDLMLPDHLIRTLHDRGYTLVSHFRRPANIDLRSHYWFSGEDLNLSHSDAIIWNSYIEEINRSGILLEERPDTLSWAGSSDGTVTAESIYNWIFNHIDSSVNNWWQELIWTWSLPPKVTLFIWLALSHRILTWENLIVRGWIGPSICFLCRRESENIDHLFSLCSFSRLIWNSIYSILNIQSHWEGSSLLSCYQSWIKNEPRLPHLPAIICWVLWNARNICIFEDTVISVDTILRWIMDIHRIYPTIRPSRKIRRIKHITLITNGIIGFFDGAAQLGISGGGGLLNLQPHNRVYHFWIGLGKGTNMRAELLALWALLILAKFRFCTELFIYGDSKVVIDWISGFSILHMATFNHWCQRILSLKNSFQNISFQHIFREQNLTADTLSKKALGCDEGILYVQEIGDVISPVYSYKLY